MNAPPASSNAARRLGVYRDTDLVGWLTRAGSQEMSFRYAETYLASTHPQPISLSLPLQAEPFDLDTSRAWFANLLPEGEIRSHVARKVGVSERNEYALLEEIGGDCAGALQLLPEASSPASAGRLIPLPWADLEAKIATTPRPALLALLTLTGELRLSLAGAQDKLPVRLERRDLFLPGGNEASTHLLKISSGGFPDLVQNELFCLTLARTVGLAVAGAALATTRTPVLLVERYDRFECGDGRIGRFHQEDFCQALGVPPESKYENEGGPSLEALFRILARGSRSPLPDKRELLTWVIFNFLIGNADAHAKKRVLPVRRCRATGATPGAVLRSGLYRDLRSAIQSPGAQDRRRIPSGPHRRPPLGPTGRSDRRQLEIPAPARARSVRSGRGRHAGAGGRARREPHGYGNPDPDRTGDRAASRAAAGGVGLKSLLLLLVSARSLLPALVPARDVRGLPDRLAHVVGDRLLRLGVARSLVEAEIRAMDPVVVAKTADRSVLGTMNDFAKIIPFHLEPRYWDDTSLETVEAKLEHMPCRVTRKLSEVISPDSKAQELAGGKVGIVGCL